MTDSDRMIPLTHLDPERYFASTDFLAEFLLDLQSLPHHACTSEATAAITIHLAILLGLQRHASTP